MLGDAKTSKLVEFGLSFDGEEMNWYSQQYLVEFSSFKEVRDRFISLFHRLTPKRVLSQLYAIT